MLLIYSDSKMYLKDKFRGSLRHCLEKGQCCQFRCAVVTYQNVKLCLKILDFYCVFHIYVFCNMQLDLWLFIFDYKFYFFLLLFRICFLTFLYIWESLGLNSSDVLGHVSSCRLRATSRKRHELLIIRSFQFIMNSGEKFLVFSLTQINLRDFHAISLILSSY